MSTESRAVAVVSGGGSGLGREIALELARRGYALALLGRRLAPLEETLDLAGQRADGLILPCDVRDAVALDALRRGDRGALGRGRPGGAGRRGDRHRAGGGDLAGRLRRHRRHQPDRRLPAHPRPAAGDEGARAGVDLPHPLGRRPPGVPRLVGLLRQQVGAGRPGGGAARGAARGAACGSARSTPERPTRRSGTACPASWNRAAMVPPREVARALGYVLDADPATLVEEVHLGPAGGAL